jgi:nucleoside-diphosphate-sugar epimerase
MSGSLPSKILITGANGKCGTALTGLPESTVFLDRDEPGEAFEGRPFVVADLLDGPALAQVLYGVEAVVHLAASSHRESSWDDVLRDNILGTRSLLEAARIAGVEQMVFASTNHVVGLYESELAPEIYDETHPLCLDHHAEIRPDSFYAVSKAAGEALCRFYAETGGPRCVCIRIGAVLAADDDHPYGYAEQGVREGRWERGSADYELKVRRLKAIWQSRRDFQQQIERCLVYDGPAFDVFYGVSDNASRWFDLEHARSRLGYRPKDRSDAWSSPP